MNPFSRPKPPVEVLAVPATERSLGPEHYAAARAVRGVRSNAKMFLAFLFWAD